MFTSGFELLTGVGQVEKIPLIRIPIQSNISDISTKIERLKQLSKTIIFDSSNSTSNYSEISGLLEYELEKIAIETVEDFDYLISEDPMKNLSPDSEENLFSMLNNKSNPSKIEILKKFNIEKDKVKFSLNIEEK